MTVAMWVAALAAGVMHVVFFCAESLWWQKPAVAKGFGMSSEQADTTKIIAFNQGFYNLMLAVGTFAGLAAWASGRETIGLTLLAWNCLTMVVAALVLISSAPHLKRGAVAQAAPPLVFLILLVIRVAGS